MGVKRLLNFIEENWIDLVEEIPLNTSIDRHNQRHYYKSGGGEASPMKTILVDGYGFLIDFAAHVQEMLTTGKLKNYFPMHLFKLLLNQPTHIGNNNNNNNNNDDNDEMAPGAKLTSIANKSNNSNSTSSNNNGNKKPSSNTAASSSGGAKEDVSFYRDFFAKGTEDQQFLNMAINLFTFGDADIIGGDCAVAVKFLELFLTVMFEKCKLKFIFAFDAPRGIDDWDEAAHAESIIEQQALRQTKANPKSTANNHANRKKPQELHIRHTIWNQRQVENQKETTQHMRYAAGKVSSKYNTRSHGGGGGGGGGKSAIPIPALFFGAVKEMIRENGKYDDAPFECEFVHLDTEVDEVIGLLVQVYKADFVLSGDTDFIVSPLAQHQQKQCKVILQQRFPFVKLIDFTIANFALQQQQRQQQQQQQQRSLPEATSLPVISRQKLISSLGIDKINPCGVSEENNQNELQQQQQQQRLADFQSRFLLFAASFTGNDITSTVVSSHHDNHQQKQNNPVRIDSVVEQMKQDKILVEYIFKNDPNVILNPASGVAPSTFAQSALHPLIQQSVQTYLSAGKSHNCENLRHSSNNTNNSNSTNENDTLFFHKTLGKIMERKAGRNQQQQQQSAVSETTNGLRPFARFLNKYQNGEIDGRFVPLLLHDISYPRPVPWTCSEATLRIPFHQLPTVEYVDAHVRAALSREWSLFLRRLPPSSSSSSSLLARGGANPSAVLHSCCWSQIEASPTLLNDFLEKIFPGVSPRQHQKFPFVEVVLWLIHPELHIEEVPLVAALLHIMMMLTPSSSSSSTSSPSSSSSNHHHDRHPSSNLASVWRRIALEISISSSAFFDERPDPRCLELAYLITSAVGQIKSIVGLFCSGDDHESSSFFSSIPPLEAAFSGTLLHALYCLNVERSDAPSTVSSINDANSLEHYALALSRRSIGNWLPESCCCADSSSFSSSSSSSSSSSQIKQVIDRLVEIDVPNAIRGVARIMRQGVVLTSAAAIRSLKSESSPQSNKFTKSGNNDDSSHDDDDDENEEEFSHQHDRDQILSSCFFRTGASPSLNSRFSTQWIGVLHRDELVDMLDEGDVASVQAGGSKIETRGGAGASARQPKDSLLTKEQREQQHKQGADDLPIMEFMQQILYVSDRCNVVALSAATGSGKSTMIPLHLYLHWKKTQSDNDDKKRTSGAGGVVNKPLSIFVTQPRRIAAVSLASRVAELLGEEVGETVGYRIGGGKEFHKDGPRTKIRFVTTGYLLEALLNANNQFWNSITHIVLDEVHERSLQADMLSLVVKQKMIDDYSTNSNSSAATVAAVAASASEGIDGFGGVGGDQHQHAAFPPASDFTTKKKLIVMSATIQSDLFRKYFSPLASIFREVEYNQVRALIGDDKDKNEKIAPSTRKFKLSEGSSAAGKSSDDGALYQYVPSMQAGGRRCKVDEYFLDEIMEKLSSKLPDHVNAALAKYNAKVNALWINPKTKLAKPPTLAGDMINAIADLSLACIQPGWSVLVFLPGLEELENTLEAINNVAHRAAGRFTVRLHVLHSIVDMEEQRKIVLPAAANECKVVLATNIAETSLTLPDLKIVIDVGMARRMCYDEEKQIRKIECRFCSKSAARQRAGRAGRVTDGIVLRMYNKHHYDKVMPEFDESEFMPLEYSVLQVRQHFGTYGPVEEVVKKLIEPPSASLVADALRKLIQWGALGPAPSYDVLDLGKISLIMPIDVSLTKAILAAAALGCAAEMTVIAAGLSIPRPLFKRPLSSYFDSFYEFVKNLSASFRSRYHFARNTRSDVHMFLAVYEEIAPTYYYANRNKFWAVCEKFELAPRQVQTFLKYVQQIASCVLKIEQGTPTSTSTVSSNKKHSQLSTAAGANKKTSSSSSSPRHRTFIDQDFKRLRFLAGVRDDDDNNDDDGDDDHTKNNKNNNSNHNTNTSKMRQQQQQQQQQQYIFFPAFQDPTSHLCLQLTMSSAAEIVFTMSRKLVERVVRLPWEISSDNNDDNIKNSNNNNNSGKSASAAFGGSFINKKVYPAPTDATSVFNRVVVFPGLPTEIITQTGAGVASNSSERAQVCQLIEKAFSDLLGFPVRSCLDLEKRNLILFFGQTPQDDFSTTAPASSTSPSSSTAATAIGNYPFTTTNLPSQPVFAPHVATHILAKLASFIPRPTSAAAASDVKQQKIERGITPIPLFPAGSAFPPIVQKARARVAASSSSDIGSGDGLPFPTPMIFAPAPALRGARFADPETIARNAAAAAAAAAATQQAPKASGKKDVLMDNATFDLNPEKWSMIAGPGTASLYPPWIEFGFAFHATLLGGGLSATNCFPALHSSFGAFLSVMTGVAVVSSIHQNKNLALAVSAIPIEEGMDATTNKDADGKEKKKGSTKNKKKNKTKAKKNLRRQTSSDSSTSDSDDEQDTEGSSIWSTTSSFVVEPIIIGTNPALPNPIPREAIAANGVLQTAMTVRVEDNAHGNDTDDYDDDDDDDEYDPASRSSARRLQPFVASLLSSSSNPYHPHNISKTMTSAMKSLIKGLVAPPHLLIEVNIILMINALSQHPYSFATQKLHLLRILRQLFDLNNQFPEMNDRTLTSNAARDLWPIQAKGSWDPKELIAGGKKTKSRNDYNNNNSNQNADVKVPRFEYIVLPVDSYFNICRTTSDTNPRDFPELKVFDVEKVLRDFDPKLKNDSTRPSAASNRDGGDKSASPFSSFICPEEKYKLWRDVGFIWGDNVIAPSSSAFAVQSHRQPLPTTSNRALAAPAVAAASSSSSRAEHSPKLKILPRSDEKIGEKKAEQPRTATATVAFSSNAGLTSSSSSLSPPPSSSPVATEIKVASTTTSSKNVLLCSSKSYKVLIEGLDSSIDFAALRRACDQAAQANLQFIQFSPDHTKATVEVRTEEESKRLLSCGKLNFPNLTQAAKCSAVF